MLSLIHGWRVGWCRGRGARVSRQRIVEAAADLLAHEGREAVTTRAVAAAAGAQAPAIYRLFGDKDGLLDAVAQHGYATFLAAKHADARPQDPVEDLRAGWDFAVRISGRRSREQAAAFRTSAMSGHRDPLLFAGPSWD